MTRRTVHVASANYPIDEPKTFDDWAGKIARWVGDGTANGAELLVFPEYAAIEYAAIHGPEVTQDLHATLEVVADAYDARLAVHRDLAEKHGVFILAGSGPKRLEAGRYVNAAQLVGPDGFFGEQVKMIMTPFEHDWGVTGGFDIDAPLEVFETAIGRISVAICYDSEFPLLVREMTEGGAEILLVPSCTERVSGYHRVRDGSRARALENQIAVVTSPTIGEAQWSPAVDINTGAAGIFVPPDFRTSETGSLAEAELNAPGWITATIPVETLRRLRDDGEMRNYIDWPRQLRRTHEKAVL